MTNLSGLPFLTIGIYDGTEYVGIIGNMDDQFTSIYILSDNLPSKLREQFLDIGEEWWWETNRQIPINIAMKSKWKEFRPYLRTFITKEFEVISGPTVKIDNLINKKIKRKQIQITRKKD